MKTKTADLIGITLDWAVWQCTGVPVTLDVSIKSFPLLIVKGEEHLVDDGYAGYSPSTDWSQGGPIIEQEKIDIKHHAVCVASIYDCDGIGRDDLTARARGPTPLIAAMRCYVASKLGDEINIPDELAWEIR